MRAGSPFELHSQVPTCPIPTVYTRPSDPCEGCPVQGPWMLLGLSTLWQQRSRKVMVTYEVDHNKVIVGIATATPTGAIRVQAALERRFSLWGIWRIHLFQNKVEVGAGSMHRCKLLLIIKGFVRDPTMAENVLRPRAWLADGLWRNSNSPRKMISTTPSYHQGDSPWDRHPPTPNSWEQTWQRVCPNWSGSPEETETLLPIPAPAYRLPQRWPEACTFSRLAHPR